MIALGFTRADMAAQAGLTGSTSGDIVTMHAQPHRLSDARARLRACLSCAKSLDSFLPLPPRRPVALAHAMAWLAAHRPSIRSELDRLAGCAQLSLELRPRATPARSLRARAAARRAADDAADHLTCALRPLAATHRTHQSVLRFDALVPRAQTDRSLAQLSGLCPETFAPWQITATGPWPPFSFFEGPA